MGPTSGRFGVGLGSGWGWFTTPNRPPGGCWLRAGQHRHIVSTHRGGRWLRIGQHRHTVSAHRTMLASNWPTSPHCFHPQGDVGFDLANITTLFPLTGRCWPRKLANIATFVCPVPSLSRWVAGFLHCGVAPDFPGILKAIFWIFKELFGTNASRKSFQNYFAPHSEHFPTQVDLIWVDLKS